MTQPEFRFVSVPAAAYPEVIEVIHRHFERLRGGMAPSRAQADEDGVVVVPGQGAWTREMLQTIKASCPYDAPLAAIEALANNAGKVTFYEDIVTSSGIPRDLFQARMGAFTKFVAKTLGEKKWPFEWGLMGDRLFYRMPTKLAEWWTAL